MSLDIFKTRYSCRNFKDEKISKESLNQILEVARLSPSSLGLEPWKFIVVQDINKLKELSVIANGQAHVAKASAVIIIVSRLDFAKYFEKRLRQRKMSEEDINTRLKLYKPFLENMNAFEKINYAREQAHIALASILYAANALNIATCTIGGFDKAKLDSYLKLNVNEMQSSLMIALGISNDEKIPAKMRFDFDEVVEFI
ncbi:MULTISPECIES: nitroreductase family protein [unclassified Campylobacter]|uniref:nitroreductase family protein n=1 Tax=unclassified Campylobacter TaxID=2593542 RepID=UPI001237ED7D|nr:MULTISPECIES: nitroreductase family protein [unclassified Campylobacter]KAA6224687.1 NAD(P)H-dependent oxidoreductase [Campylobacter sp. LR185c]KAA6225685.1 NAD(P)H-dependent oxidoreductase [Campylobacter sp. LR286c]KAA6225805.1 NAD(P)H-dependent oxidoreductase [Campylobacter sp. LR196d]KAA6230096.1 NAD(P)H-dependent oxidoreductase [Campylobacter sp. LR264d]KAA8603971.1 NAD(P)H-dependent oxidoreductase [Campylobacter sp. LR185c]